MPTEQTKSFDLLPTGTNIVGKFTTSVKKFVQDVESGKKWSLFDFT